LGGASGCENIEFAKVNIVGTPGATPLDGSLLGQGYVEVTDANLADMRKAVARSGGRATRPGAHATSGRTASTWFGPTAKERLLRTTSSRPLR
jgi:hypothetical protein